MSPTDAAALLPLGAVKWRSDDLGKSFSHSSRFDKETTMNDPFQQRVRAAAVAGWWTVLIAIVFLSLVWFAFVGLMSSRPAWMQSILGPGVTWEYVQNITFWAVSIFKVCIWLTALVVVWLTIWARQLRKTRTSPSPSTSK